MTGSEGDAGDPHGDPAIDEEAPFPIGDYLARQRRLRGVSMEELAQITRIPQRSLERLEEGAFDGESDGFARGFVRSVAEALGLDAEDTTMLMLSEPAVEPGHSPRFSSGWRLVLGVAAVILIGTGFWLARGRAPEVPPAEPTQGAPLVRRDAVRALAEAEGLLRAEQSPGASEGEPGAEPASR